MVKVSPKAIKAWREAEVASGAKSNAADAEVIAEHVRLRQHRLSVVEPFSAAARALRAVVRARDDLVHQRVAAANRLEACLDAYWPGAKRLFCDIESNIALAFLEDYPTPASAARVGEWRMAAFLDRHKYTGNRSPGELVERLRGAPAGIAAGPKAEARRAAMLGYVAVIRARSIKELEGAIAARLGEHPDAVVFTSLPRSAVSTPLRCSPSGATAEKPTTRTRCCVRPGRRHTRDQVVGQASRGGVPVVMQQALSDRHHHLRRQLATLEPVGGRHLRPGPTARL